jgi:hypothetical protein
MYFEDLGLVLLCLAMYALSGWWIIAPVRERLTYPLCAAVLAGLPTVALGVLAINVISHAPIGTSAIIAAIVFTLLTAAALREDGWRTLVGGDPASQLGVIVVVAAAATWILAATDRHFGDPGILFYSGTDQLGYSHIADWLLNHPASSPSGMAPAPSELYASWPQVIFSTDPRFGSFASLGVIAHLSNRSGIFAFDLTSAVVTSAGVLGLAGLFARNRWTLVLLCAGLVSSYWFDWTRHGFLGKVAAFPVTLFAAGLFCIWVDARLSENRRIAGLLGLVTVAVGAGLMWNGLVTSIIVFLVGATFLASRRIMGVVGSLREHFPAICALALVAGAPLVALGVFARPLYFREPPVPFTWFEVLLRASEVEGIDGLSRWPDSVNTALVVGLAVVWVGLGVIAVISRNASAVAWLGVPALLLVGLYLVGKRWTAYNLVGLYYPMLLAGIALLVGFATTRRWQVGLSVLLAGIVLLHLPRFLEVRDNAGGSKTPRTMRISSEETDRLVTLVKRNGGAYVDAESKAALPLFLMNEFGRRGLDSILQWSPGSWHRVAGYRHWRAPRYEHRAALVILPRAVDDARTPGLVLRNTMFDVIRRP